MSFFKRKPSFVGRLIAEVEEYNLEVEAEEEERERGFDGLLQVVRNFNALGYREIEDSKDSRYSTMHIPTDGECSVCGRVVSGSLCFSCGSAQ